MSDEQVPGQAPEHAALADGTVLRELSLRQLSQLRWDPEQGGTVWASAGRS